MPNTILTLAATGLAGLVLGAGVGVASAQDTGGGRTPVEDPASMDELHDAMRDQMPAELVAECDAMHATMVDHTGAMDLGSMGSMMGDGDWSTRHAQHHPEMGS